MFNRTAVVLYCLAVASSGCHRKPAQTIIEPVISELYMRDQSSQHRLLRGFYEIREEEWRWTSRMFAVSLDPPPTEGPTYLELDCNLPRELMNQAGTVTLSARVNGVEAGRQTYDKPGRYLFARRAPLAALGRKPAEVEFELDKSITDAGAGRVLGLIAVSVALKEQDQTAEYLESQARLAREGYAKASEQRHLHLPPKAEEELMKLFHELPVWESLWIQNVRIIKNPLDLWMMQQIIYEVRPDFIVETGTWYGGSALYWAHTLNGMGLNDSRVLTVDIGDFTWAASSHFLWKKYVQFFRGSSTDPGIVSEIARMVKGRKTLVTLDSDHSMGHVLRELRMYSPMISPGSYLVVEDTHLDGVPTHPEQGPGPYAAVLRFLREGGSKDFEQDFSRETMALTFNPGGWLRRK